MVKLTPDECRVLGVMVEKAHTVASQYPMSLNAIVVGSNQKSNRDPIMNIDEDRAVRALEGLREKQLVLFADTIGSRVMKYRHNCREALDIGTSELVMLTELLLRGPQTPGELRTRASRMHPLGTLDEVQNLLKFMTQRDDPLVRLIPPSPGSRVERYAQLLCPNLHRLDAPPVQESYDEMDADEAGARAGAEASLAEHRVGSGGRAGAPAGQGSLAGLAGRVEMLEGDVLRLRRVVEQLASALGETDILRALGPISPQQPNSEED